MNPPLPSLATESQRFKRRKEGGGKVSRGEKGKGKKEGVAICVVAHLSSSPSQTARKRREKKGGKKKKSMEKKKRGERGVVSRSSFHINCSSNPAE